MQIQPHWYQLERYHALIAFIIVQMINAMPAPTKDSRPVYVWFFRVLSSVPNLVRAWMSQVEKSPNFVDAVDLHLASREQRPRES